MSEEILVNVTPFEARVALVENGVLQEVFIERERRRGIVGNIYLGKVVRVLPGMQAAFVDIGLDKASFIHARDLCPWETSTKDPEEQDIRALLREGQTLLVQVVKDPIGTKGAKVTASVTLASRNLVYLPDAQHIGVSAKIEDEQLRETLKQKLQAAIERVCSQNTAQNLPALNGGFIVRTAAESQSDGMFEADIHYLARLWRALQKKITTRDTPSIIYQELRLYERVIRDFVYPGLEKIRVDSEQVFTELTHFSQAFVPEYLDKIEHYTAARPIFDLFGVEDEIAKALGRQVSLKSGGYLVIDQTEAMTTIDVNTGGFVGKSNPDETVYKTNLEAATVLARQLRLRNLGGMVIVDFIDMTNQEHRRQVLRALEKALAKDRAKTSVSDFSNLGLVELTRKRTQESLQRILCESCEVCQSRGFVRSAETVCSDIFREIMRNARAYEDANLLVLASQTVIDRLLDEDAEVVAELQESLAKSINFQVEPMYSQEQYDVVFV